MFCDFDGDGGDGFFRLTVFFISDLVLSKNFLECFYFLLHFLVLPLLSFFDWQ